MGEMLAPLAKILLCFAFCLALFSCPDSHECIKYQDVAVVQTSSFFLDGSFFDNFVVSNKGRIVKRCKSVESVLLGSRENKAKFPVHIEVQFFLRESLIESLEFDMPENSTLTFYNGIACDSATTSSENPSREAEFYRAVERAMVNDMLIDFSRSEKTCWVMQRIDEDDYMRCTQHTGEDQEHSWCREGL